MSWKQLCLVRTKRIWSSFAQFAVAEHLAFLHHDKVGYALASKQELADVFGVSVSRVKDVIRELEAMEALTRIGAEAAVSAKQRYVVDIERAVRKHRRSPSVRGGAGNPVLGAPADQEGGGRHTPGGVPAHPPVAPRVQRYSEVQDATPPLPGIFPAPAKPPTPNYLQANAEQDRRRKEVYAEVRDVAAKLLRDPERSAAIVNGDRIDESLGALIEAVKRTIAEDRPRLFGWEEVLHAACVSELFKHRNQAVLRGEALRPRDRRRRSQ